MTTISKIDQIRDLLKSIETGDPGPVAVVNEARYIQHNPQTHEGSAGLAQLFAQLSKTNPRVHMVRGFEDGPFVFAHMEYDFSSPKICFEVFRFEEGRVVEHWDNLQERAGPNISGRSMVDGPVAVEDTELREENRALVKGFVESVLIPGALDRLGFFVGPDGYREHNPDQGDGIVALRAALGAQGHDGRRLIQYQRLHRVLADGNFVLSVSEGLRDGVPTAFYDLYRIAHGHLVEHWDTVETIAPRSDWKNDNGKF
ncbi:MAG: hypothetical protein OIF40_16210 [Mangrovicoccus sp.]|nr:hypothetical protein [Mangrovicoccus sp.]